MTASSPDDLFREYLRAGDPEAFARLYDAVRPELLRTANRLAPNASCAEDLVQATFLGALESAGRFERGNKVIAWLHGILKNQARLMRWRDSRKPEAERLVWPEVSDPVEQAEGKELQSTLSAALKKLGSIYEPIMRAHLREDLNAQEIAARNNRPAGTVRTQIVRGTAMLRQLLPVGIATMLFVRLTPGLTAADVRAELVVRAGQGIARRSWLAKMTMRKAALAVGATVVVTISSMLAISLAAGGAEPFAGPPLASIEPTKNEVVDVPATEIDFGTSGRTLANQIERTGLEVIVSDGTNPAAGIPVELLPVDDMRFDRHVLATDADGTVRFEDLAPGQYRVLPLATGASRDKAMVVVPADRTHTHRITVTDLITHKGRVVDDGGFAVADATIWLSDGDFVTSGRSCMPFAKSDATGHFTLVSYGMSNISHVQATTATHGASPFVRIPRTDDNEIVVQVSGASAAVTGNIVDKNGDACPGVLVRATLPGRRTRARAMDQEGDTFGGVREVRSDAEGRFSVPGFAAGHAVRLTAWSADFAREERIVAAGNHTQFTMTAGATVRGRIRASSQPFGMMLVSVGDEPKDDRLPCMVRCNSNGEFVLAGLTPGDNVTITAESPAPPLGLGNGKVQASLRLQSGHLYDWDAQLIDGSIMGGVVRSSDGTPLADWRIGINAIDKKEGRRSFTAKTDSEGRFTMKNLPKSRYSFEPRPRYGSDAMKFIATWPLQTNYELVIDAERVAWAMTTVRARADIGKAQPQQPSLPTGRLDVLGVKNTDRINLSLWLPNGKPAMCNIDWDPERKVYTSELPPGRYELAVSCYWFCDGVTTAAEVIEFTIASGSPTTLQPALRKGIQREFRIEEPSPFLGSDGGYVTVIDESGKVIGRNHAPHWFNTDPSRFEAKIALAPGRYTVQLVTGIGQRGELPITIRDLTPDDRVLTIKVK